MSCRGFWCAAIFMALVGGAAVAVEPLGKFVGTPVTRWEPDGRSMTLMDSFEFIDADGRRWRVPSGIRVDGASIPTAFWSLIGGPFEGKFRDASVVHDYFCNTRRRRWQDVHKVFHHAMLASGVSSSKAWIMFKAVEKFGPRWEEPKTDPKCLNPDGKFNFDKCTENSGVMIGSAVYPSMGKNDVLELIEEVEGSATADDIKALKKIADTVD